MTSTKEENARGVSRIRQAAAAARPADRRMSPESEEIAQLKARLDSQEQDLVAMRELLNASLKVQQETFEALREMMNRVSDRVLANERMISTKTIESLTRNQVARIMREEGAAAQ